MEGWEFLKVPWLVGMVILFALEFVEGITITRLYFMRLRRLARAALAQERVTPELAGARAEQLASFTHFLDIPILLVIVSLGALRPSDWTQFVIGIVIAVVAASLLNYFIPRLYPWGAKRLGHLIPSPNETTAARTTKYRPLCASRRIARESGSGTVVG
jgi:predicted integral membrane protein DUF2269